MYTIISLAFAVQCFGGAQAGSATEVYTQNAICRQNHCINPLFPGLNDLPRLEQLSWQCSEQNEMADHINFCKEAVRYNAALPSPNKSASVSKLIKAQDDAAATMYFYHLNGMGYEAWDNKEPHKSTDRCVQAVWKMVCFTYFPRAQASCKKGEKSEYLRPCAGTCQDYLAQCGVECCDESPQCVFSHPVEAGEKGETLTQTGYVNKPAPSTICTGSGSHGLRAPLLLVLGLCGLQLFTSSESAAPVESPKLSSFQRRGLGISHWLLVCALGAMALLLHGCDLDVAQHHVGNWRKKDDYLVEFAYVIPGQAASTAKLNSCADKNLAERVECSGRGYCKEWNTKELQSDPNEANDVLSFCVCDRDWADPECSTRRKSQVTAFLCSLFGGFVGVDYFYLGFPCWGIVKAITLGGFGSWWLMDIVRTGAGPIYAHDFRVAHDLPHWVYVISTISLFMLVGFIFSIESYMRFRKAKRKEVRQMQESEEYNLASKSEEADGPRYRLPGQAPGMPRPHELRREFSGYGATVPMHLPNGGAPYAAYQGSPVPPGY